MKLHNLARIGLVGALLATTTQVATAQDGPRLYLGVGNTSSEYWQQMIWGATTMIESVGGTIEIVSNDFDPQKSIQNMSAIVAAGCEGCLFVWFPDSPSIVPVLVERVTHSLTKNSTF